EKSPLRQRLHAMRAHTIDYPDNRLHQPERWAFVLLCHGDRGHKSRMQADSQARNNPASPGARPALGLLLVINLFCYLDRYILAAVIPAIKHDFLFNDPDANGKVGLLTTAFIVSYMLFAPLFGWLADRASR